MILIKTIHLTIPEAINKLIAIPLLKLGSTLPAVILAILAIQFLWSVGIHGAALVGGILGPIWLTFTQENSAAKLPAKNSSLT